MAEYKIFRAEQSMLSDPHSRIEAHRVAVVEGGAYMFSDNFGRLLMAYPVKSFFVARVE